MPDVDQQIRLSPRQGGKLQRSSLAYEIINSGARMEDTRIVEG